MNTQQIAYEIYKVVSDSSYEFNEEVALRESKELAESIHLLSLKKLREEKKRDLNRIRKVLGILEIQLEIEKLNKQIEEIE